ncbi:MAG: cobyrinate a,c-diamide synthase [Proteobacteria bacterium]|nr:cobyrinate a,c-diamide synthase [Pseudomonadota bacterium]
MSASRPRLLISALKGGAGKTSLSLGLSAAWRAAGRRVAPFKKGPDYIDPGWLSLAAGASCRNLDPYLMTPRTILDSFGAHSAEADVALVEGNRGLYDGFDAKGTYSSAELAKLLGCPVILVVDCTKVTRTVGALVVGCLQFDPEVNFGGVVLNRVAGSRHQRLIERVIRDYTDLPVLGAVPRLADERFPERHMGLVPPAEHGRAEESLAVVTALAREHLDLEALWAVAQSAPDWKAPAPGSLFPDAEAGPPVRLGVVRDSAFWFYYPENLEALKNAGADLVSVSALGDGHLPDLDGLYIGGGFPETHAPELAANESFRASVLEAARGGLPVWAECGGLMYLARELVVHGRAFPMVGLFDLSLVMEQRPQAHGYTRLTADGANPYFPPGATLAGHEFHYSRPAGPPGRHDLAFTVDRGCGVWSGRDGLVSGRTLATFTHLHALASPEWAPALVRLARQGRG